MEPAAQSVMVAGGCLMMGPCAGTRGAQATQDLLGRRKRNAAHTHTQGCAGVVDDALRVH